MMHIKSTSKIKTTSHFLAAACALSILVVGCESSSSDDSDDGGDFGDRDPSQVAVIGDSIAAGYGDAGAPWPARMARMLDRTVFNFAVPGATSADARSRLESALARNTGFIIIAVGANDAIKGYDAETVEANLAAMIARTRAAKAYPVVGNVIGMTDGHLLYNGAADKVNEAIKSLCRSEGVLLVDLNAAVSLDLLQSDGLHPDSNGQEVIARAFYNKLKKRVY